MRRGLCLAGLWTLLWACKAGAAAAPRTLWLFQQIGRFGPPTQQHEQVSLEADFDQIGDTLSLAGRGTIPLGPVQVKAKASQRLFLDLSDAGKTRHAQLNGQATFLSAEIGRAFLSNRRHYGSLGVEVTHILPSSENYLGLLIHTGTYDTADQPWSVGFSLQVRFRLTGNESNLILDGGTERVLWEGPAGKLRAGAALIWAQRLKDGPAAAVTEHAVLTLGPQVTWNNALGEWKIRVPFRLWLDRDTPTTTTAYLSEFDLPAVTAFWIVRF